MAAGPVSREQFAAVLWRDDDGWKLSADVGERGVEHAKRMNTQTFPVEEGLAASLLSTASLSVAEHDASLAKRIFRFFDRRPAP